MKPGQSVRGAGSVIIGGYGFFESGQEMGGVCKKYGPKT